MMAAILLTPDAPEGGVQRRAQRGVRECAAHGFGSLSLCSTMRANPGIGTSSRGLEAAFLQSIRELGHFGTICCGGAQVDDDRKGPSKVQGALIAASQVIERLRT